MQRVDFYHLTRDPAPVVIARIAEQIVARDDRLLIVARDVALAARIDEALWATNPASFLAHSPPGADAATSRDDPIVIAASAETAANGATIIALADGLWDDAAAHYARALLFFDGSSVDSARGTWRVLGTQLDVERHYWRQNEQGRWSEGP
ncbi:MAG: DNA polymerase III subunit chi [Sphingopyxis sp.]|jgi:DNA polymerase-3 subunit chi|nr:DNA polymerase III subunit chi [Sphingopyxis sp.]